MQDDENLLVHSAEFDGFAIHQSDFGLVAGFGAYEYDILHDRPAELVWAFEGVMTAHVGPYRWLLTAAHALWVPAAVPSQVIANRRSRGYCLQFTGDCPVTWTTPTLVAMTPMVRELIHHLGRPGLTEGAARRARAVLFDVLEPARGDAALRLPLPSDDRALTVAHALLTSPADPRTLDEWAETVFTSGKTLQRAFATQAGMSFADWRTQSRLYASLPLLAEGQLVSAVAGRVGYTSTNGYIDAFRRHFGHTPATHFADSPAA